MHRNETIFVCEKAYIKEDVCEFIGQMYLTLWDS